MGELLLHLLLGVGLVSDCRGVIALEAVNDLVNDGFGGGGIGLLVKTKGIGGDGRLASLDGLLGGFEMIFEMWPSFIGCRLIVPFSNVTGENGRPGDDEESDINQLFGCFGGMGSFSHVGVVVDFSEDGHDGTAMVVGGGFHFGFCGGEGLRSDGSICVEEGLDDVGNGALQESCVIVD